MEPNSEPLRRVSAIYERARFAHGLRASLWTLPMLLASLGGCGRASPSLAIGVAMACVTCFLFWRGGGLERGARVGLIAGVVSLGLPLLAVFVIDRAGGGSGLCLLACVLGGAGAGAIVTSAAMKQQCGRLSFVLAGGVLAALAGSLGCIDAGLTGTAAMAVGVALVAPIGLGLARTA